MIVMKFGGTSVGSAARMKHVADLVQKYPSPRIVVLSAMSGTTDSLVKIADYLKANNTEGAIDVWNQLREKYQNEINQLYASDLTKKQVWQSLSEIFDAIRQYFHWPSITVKEEKFIVAGGELMSTLMFYHYLNEINHPATLLPALDFMKIDENGEPDYTYIREKLNEKLNLHKDIPTYVTQGFICRNPYGDIDNLKRGGSDYTASIIGSVVQASEVQIWTDIDGIHNNDPRYVKNTRPIHYISFDEAAELAYFGAKILHPSSVLPAKYAGIPVRLKNTLDPEAFGTIISNQSDHSGHKAVAAKDGITAIKIKSGRMLLAYGFLRKVFEIFELYKTPIDVITTSEVAVSLTIDDQRYLDEIVADLKKLGTVEVDHDLSIICIVGNYSEESKGYAAEVFEALKEIPIRMISYGGSKYNITVVVKSSHKESALKLLQQKLFEKNELAGDLK